MLFFYALIASLVISVVLAPKPQVPKPTAFEDIDFPLSEDGESKPVVFGQVWTKSWMVLSVGNYQTQAIKTRGGKK